MAKGKTVAQTDYKKALMGSSYDKMFPGWSSMVNKDVFASYFGTTDYYYDLAKNTRRMVILDKVRVVQNIALNTTNPYAKLPPIFKKTTVCYDMDDFIKALACQEFGIIAYGTDEADEDKDDEYENDDSSKKTKKEKFAKRLDKMMKEVKSMFDYVVTNPPYSGSLHLDFFELGINHIKRDENGNKIGQMTIIEPATWLINVRKNGKASRYDEIKKLIGGHVKKVVIENFNKEFSTGMSMPFSITYVDFSKTYDTIEFECCGEKKVVKSIYDCNLIGNYDTIWSILNKVLAYGDMMKSHVTDKPISTIKDVKYLPYNQKLGGRNGYYSDPDFINCCGGLYYGIYSTPAVHKIRNKIYDYIPTTKGGINPTTGKKHGGNPDNCTYGTQHNLENWRHFALNNKLPLFINIVMSNAQDNNSKEFLPWLVDKQYTDEEINKMFGFTEDEIALIDKTLEKFERNSSWFKRYMCGPDVDSK